MLKGSVLIFIVLLIPVLCAAQQDSTFTSRANVVSVPTLVLDRELKTVEGLRAPDFVIEDDGIAQKILLDDDPDVQPISLMIAVQCGRRAAREYGRISTLASMLDPALAGPDTEAALLLFDSKLNLRRISATVPNELRAY